ncbi:MAG: ATP-binding protein [Clostridia bacterium]|nr:ATP-binding protein [Clostridia bacterium]
MAIPVLILGESGSGKSASLRNFSPGEVGVINVSNKPLPFRTEIKTLNTDDYGYIQSVLLSARAKSIVIDDAQYLMANEFMRTAKVTGYQKFTDIALNFWNLVQTVIRQMPEDRIVYFLSHIERDQNSYEKMKTVGRMLDEKITVEGLFTIVLKTSVQDGKYSFRTQTNGMDTVKSPIGMFSELAIDNDLKLVDGIIRDYYGLNKQEEERA